jgi:hypothetical protein
MLILGGNIKGGKVYGKWPVLEVGQLYEGRDLAITTDSATCSPSASRATSARATSPKGSRHEYKTPGSQNLTVFGQRSEVRGRVGRRFSFALPMTFDL